MTCSVRFLEPLRPERNDRCYSYDGDGSLPLGSKQARQLAADGFAATIQSRTAVQPLAGEFQQTSVVHEYRQERRRHHRSAVARHRPFTVSIGKSNAGLMINVGTGGVALAALSRPLAAGATLTLQFHFPLAEAPSPIVGTVVWTNRAQAGIRFVSVPAEFYACLRGWITANKLAVAASEIMASAGGCKPALRLMSELVHMLTGAAVVRVSLPDDSFALGQCGSVRSAIAAPIYDGDEIVGQFEMLSHELGAFEEQDLHALQVLSVVIAEMTRIHTTTKREAAEKASRLSSRIMERVDSLLRRPSSNLPM